MYISLGSDCCIKKRMEEFILKEKEISHMFDWVLSDFKAVIKVLKSDTSIMNEENFSILTKTIDEKYAIQNKNCYFISLHDAPITVSEEEGIRMVSEKYKRRMERFIEYIKCPDNEITFVGIYDDHNPIQNGNMTITDEDIHEFFEQLHRICPLHNHKLTLVLKDISKLKECMKYKNKVTIIDSEKFINMDIYTRDWYRFFLDWNAISGLISKNE